MIHVAHRAQERAHVHVVTLRLERNCDMKRRTFGAACLIGIVLTATARVQGADEGVLLRYHFQPGQEYRYRITMSGDMATMVRIVHEGLASPEHQDFVQRLNLT